MGRIPEERLQEILRANDIVDVISQYVPLKASGRRFVALCPFHREKTPSFGVNPELQIYKCFGCGEGGNAYSFLMAHERLAFREAVEVLARRAGIEIGPLARGPEESGIPRLREALGFAADFYQAALRSPAGAGARRYLASRRIPEQLVREFHLGLAPRDGSALLAAARPAGFEQATLARAGLVQEKEGLPPRDLFRGRLLFPIHDTLGRVVGFGARALDDSQPKYLNSPETPVFQKGRLLYGLHLAKAHLREERPLVLVEGYVDVLAARAGGVPNVAAPLGTAFGREHVRLIRNYAQRVVLLFDGDEAGTRAAERAADLLLEEEMDGAVARLPPGVDPADHVFGRGATDLPAQVEGAIDLFGFKKERVLGRFPVETVEGKVRAADVLLAAVIKGANPLRRDLYLREIAQALGLDEGHLRARALRLAPGGAGAPRRPARPSGARGARGTGGPAAPDRRPGAPGPSRRGLPGRRGRGGVHARLAVGAVRGPRDAEGAGRRGGRGGGLPDPGWGPEVRGALRRRPDLLGAPPAGGPLAGDARAAAGGPGLRGGGEDLPAPGTGPLDPARIPRCSIAPPGGAGRGRPGCGPVKETR